MTNKTSYFLALYKYECQPKKEIVIGKSKALDDMGSFKFWLYANLREKVKQILVFVKLITNGRLVLSPF